MSPVPLHAILWGFVLGGVCRGVLVGIIVTAMSLFLLTFILPIGLLPFTPSWSPRSYFHWVVLSMRCMPNLLMTSPSSQHLC